MTTPITVDPAVFAHTAQSYLSARDAAATVLRDLAAGLTTAAGCTGADAAGTSWADRYDRAAVDAVGAGSSLVRAHAKMHDLLHVTGINHSNAESQSTFEPNPNDVVSPPAPAPPFDVPKFKGAFGGDGSTPFGWSLISRWAQGRRWPDGNGETLRALGSAWRTAATGLRGIGQTVSDARHRIETQQSPEISQILGQIDLVARDVVIIASAFVDLAITCEEFGNAVDGTHRTILDELAGFVAAAGAAQAGNQVLASALGGVLVTGTSGELVGTRIAACGRALDAAAAAQAVSLAAVSAAAVGVSTNLQPLLNAQATRFDTATRAG